MKAQPDCSLISSVHLPSTYAAYSYGPVDTLGAYSYSLVDTACSPILQTTGQCHTGLIPVAAVCQVPVRS